MEAHDEEVDLDTKSGRLPGCRGRVLIAMIVLAVLFILLAVIMFMGMMQPEQPQPRKRAAVEEVGQMANLVTPAKAEISGRGGARTAT